MTGGGPRSILGLLLAFARWIFGIRGMPVLIPFAALTLLDPTVHAQSQTYNLQTSIANLQVGGAAGYTDCSPTLSPTNPAFDSTGQLAFTFKNNCPKETLQTSGTVTVKVPTSFTGTISGSQIVVSGSPLMSGMESVTFTPSQTSDFVELGIAACGANGSVSNGSSTATATMLPCALPSRLSIGSNGGTSLSLSILNIDLTITATLVYTPANPGTTYSLQSAPSSFVPAKVSGCTLTLPSSPAFDATGQIAINFTNNCGTYQETGTLTLKFPLSITGTLDSLGTGITGITGSQMITATLTETATTAAGGANAGFQNLTIKWEAANQTSGQCFTATTAIGNGGLTATATLPTCLVPSTLLITNGGLQFGFFVVQPDMSFSAGANYYPGTTPPPTPHIGVSPALLSFGNVLVGDIPTQTLTVSNTGSAALTVSGIASSDSAYSVTAPSIPFTVAANGSSKVTVQYAPVAVATDNATLTITSNDSSSPNTSVALSGAGVCSLGGTGPTVGGSMAAPAPATCMPPSISIQTAVPRNGNPLLAVATMLPPFCAFGTYTSGPNPVLVDLVLSDSMGNVITSNIAQSPTFPAGQGQSWGGGCANASQLVFLKEAAMPPLNVPSGAKYNTVITTFKLQAVMTDAVTLKTLVISDPVLYPVELGADVTSSELDVTRVLLDNTADTILDPTKNVFRKTTEGLADSIVGDFTGNYLTLKINYDFAGSSAQFNALIQQEDANGKVVDSFTSFPEGIPGAQPLGLIIPGGASLTAQRRFPLYRTSRFRAGRPSHFRIPS